MGDDGEDRSHARRNLAGALFILAVLALGLWLADLFAQRQALERCLNSGRRDCAPLQVEKDKLPAEQPRVYSPTR